MRAPGSDFERKGQRREVARHVRRLPPVLQSCVKSIRVPQILADVVATIEGDVRMEAMNRGLLRQGSGPQNLHELDRRAILEGMAEKRDYRRRVQNLVNEACRSAHLDWVRRSEGESLPDATPRVIAPGFGEWEAKADLGLGTAAYLEAMPDAVAIWLAGILVEMDEAEPESEFEMDPTWGPRSRAKAIPPKSVLVFGAGPGTLAAAVDAMTQPGSIQVTEVDCVPSERESSCVVARYPDLTSAIDATYDAVVWHLPSPAGEGAGKHRFMYYAENGTDAVPLDLGRLGVRSWKKWLRRFVDVSGALIGEEGRVIFLVPTGVRTARGYDEGSELVDDLEGWLREAGFRTERNLLVRETGSVAQPYISKNRCPWRLVVAHRKDLTT